MDSFTQEFAMIDEANENVQKQTVPPRPGCHAKRYVLTYTTFTQQKLSDMVQTYPLSFSSVTIVMNTLAPLRHVGLTC